MKIKTTHSQKLQLLSAWRHENIHSLLQTAWALLLHCYTGSNDVCFGYQYFDSSDTGDLSTVSLTINEDDSVLAILQNVTGKYHLIQDPGMRTVPNVVHDSYMLYNTTLMIRVCDSTQNSTSAQAQSVLAIALPDKSRVRLHVKLLEKDISMFLEWWSDEISTEQIKSVAKYFEKALAQIISEDDVAVKELDGISESDWSRVCKFNSVIPESLDRCIHEVIREQALLHPENEAVCAWDGSLTYKELDILASRVAYCLQEQGVGPEIRVALCFDKSKWNIVAMLGVLKAGGAFVPLDPAYPTYRVQYLMRLVKASILMCSRKHEENLKYLTQTLIPLDGETLERVPASPEKANPQAEVKSHNAAYVIFTSGSTGEPKGTLVEHRAYVSGAVAHAPQLHINADSRVLQFAAHTFDASLIDILTTLMHGACICVPSEEQRLNEVVNVIRDMEVNRASLTPSFVDFIDISKIPGLKTLVLAGEVMSQSHLDTWSRIKLINAYGPTECSVHATASNKITPTSDCRDIGLPAGVRCWIVNPQCHDQLVPVGCVGELLLEGPTLARCYINSTGKTAEAFIYNPSWAKAENGSHSDRRFYKTGDLVRYNSDAGSLTYIGRKDTQVKLHGQRIELGEIEDNLNADPTVKHCLVSLPKSGFYESKLVAVISLSEQSNASSESDAVPLRLRQHLNKAAVVAEIRHRLSSRLPTYMIPSSWLCVEALPQLASRKLDRKATATWVAKMENDPEIGVAKLSIDSNEGIIRSENLAEDRLASIWSRVLNIPKSHISLDESFLSLGGDSIAAITCMGFCKKQGIGITVQEVLQSKSIKNLATQVTEINHVTVYEETVEQTFDLSPIQKLHFMMRKERQGYFNQGVSTRLNQPIGERDLRNAIEALVKRHSMLRARYTSTGTRIKQRITEEVAGSYCLRTHNVGWQDDIEQAIADSQLCINAFVGPTMTVDLFHVDGGETILSMIAHHLVVDIVSWRIILEDLEDFLLNPQQDTPGNGSLPFQTWCRLQEAQYHEAETTKSVDPGSVPPPEFAYWGMESHHTTYGDVDCETFEISPEESASLLMECHQSLQTEPIDLFLASLLHGFRQTFTDRPLPVIYNEGHGREVWDPAIDISRTVGWFTILQPIFLSHIAMDDPVDAVIQVKDLRRRVSDNGRQAFTRRAIQNNHHCPMEITFNYVGQHRDLQRKDGLFQLINQMAGETGRGGGAADFGEETPRFALFEISAVALLGSLRFTFTFNRYIEHQTSIRTWISTCQSTLKYLGAKLRSLKPRPTLSSFPMLPLTYRELETILSNKLPSIGIHSSDLVEDIYPCSRMQEGILLSRSRDEGLYAVHDTLEVKGLGCTPDANHLALAWQKVVSRHPMLRTIFVENFTSQNLFCQVVLKNFDSRPNFVRCLKDHEVLATLDEQQPMAYHKHQPPHRLTICETETGRLFCRIEISHISMDGSSISIILRDLQLAYGGKLDDRRPMFKNFISYLQNVPQQNTLEYWCSYLSNFKPCHLPLLNDGMSTSKQLRTMRLNLGFSEELQKVCEQDRLTLSTAFSTAWGLTLRSFCGTDDVCFSYITSLRDVPVEDIELVVGPVISLLPCRMNASGNLLLSDILHQVQKDYMEQVPHKHASLIDIQHSLKLSDTTLFNTGISFRQLPRFSDTKEWIEFLEVGAIYDPAEFPVFINIEVSDDEIRIDLNHWTTALSDGQAKSVASTFIKSLENIIHHKSKNIGLIDGMNDWTQQQIATWNSKIPQKVDGCIHEVLEDKASLQPDSMAVASWDGNLTYSKLNELSSVLATYLTGLGVSPGALVPLYLGKSTWHIASILAVIKAGGTCIPMDEYCIQGSFDQWFIDSRVQVALTSPTTTHMLEGTIPYVIPVGKSLFEYLPKSTAENSFPVQPSDDAYVIFTAQKTRPVVLNHTVILSRAKAFAEALDMDQKTRMFQFSSPTSDMFVQELFGTLLHGGCLCIPSDSDVGNLSASINASQANCISITPSIASSLLPSSIPEVQVLALYGEGAIKRLTETWSPKVRLHTFYGSAECSSICVHNSACDVSSEVPHVGSSLGCISWLVDPHDHDILLPIGCAGELVVEGPIVSHGYLDKEQQPLKNFFENPKWISNFKNTPVNREETIHQVNSPRRMFKTGDLARYNSDGTLVYLGRKDKETSSQSEISKWKLEQHISALLPAQYHCAVETINYPNKQAIADNHSVFIFFENTNSKASKDNYRLISQTSPQFYDVIATLHTKLSRSLPLNQVPSLYFPVAEMPLTSFGKLNRLALRNCALELPDDVRLGFHVNKFNEFWRLALAGSAPNQFPPVSIKQGHKTNTSWSRPIKLRPAGKTAVLAAWALALYGYTASRDVCFGQLLLEPEISNTVVPRRFHIDEATPINEFLGNINQALAVSQPFQKGGLQRIRNLSADSTRACNFTNLLWISDASKERQRTCQDIFDANAKIQDESLAYPLILCINSGEDMEVSARYDRGALSASHIERIISRFMDYLDFLNSASKTQDTISCMAIFEGQNIYTISTDMDYWKKSLADVEPCLFPSLCSETPQGSFGFTELELKSVPDIHKLSQSVGSSTKCLLQVIWGLVLRCYTGMEDVCFGYCPSITDKFSNGQDCTKEPSFEDALVCRLCLNDDIKIAEAVQTRKQEFETMLLHPIFLAQIQKELGFHETTFFNTIFKFEEVSSVSDRL
ncbi:Nonribosomal peptide synthetases (NRPS), partial [Aspergillus tanneri]